ncbi:MAG TPA: hypothetical protein VNO14_16135 [Blastocatellia bacterium]|nr:hypothetical protein [Blastocatellia bacterium]
MKARAKRIKSQGRLIAILSGILVLAVFFFWFMRFALQTEEAGGGAVEVKSAGRPEAVKPAMPVAFEGASFESSGVIHVPGTDGVLFIDDGRPSGCYWVQLDGSGQQAGPVRYVSTGADVEDPESITFDGNRFYIMGSQSDPKAGKRNAFIRFDFDPDTSSISDVEKIEDLRSFLLRSVPELRGAGEKAGSEGGLNVEGITWDPRNSVFLLGLRSPMIEGPVYQALVIAIRLKEADGPFALSNIELAEPEPIRLRLGNSGIRDIHYDSRLGTFLIIAGAPKDRERGSFSLWQWGGRRDGGGLREIATLDSRLKPEGITRVEAAGNDFVFMVYDSSSYSSLDYASIGER